VHEGADRVRDQHAPARGPVCARDLFSGLEQLDTRTAEPAIRLREPDRKQIGVEQGGCNFVREPPEALRRQRFIADQSADRFGAIERAPAGDGHWAAHPDCVFIEPTAHNAPYRDTSESPPLGRSIGYCPFDLDPRPSVESSNLTRYELMCELVHTPPLLSSHRLDRHSPDSGSSGGLYLFRSLFA
jgi:hypothetical protein